MTRLQFNRSALLATSFLMAIVLVAPACGAGGSGGAGPDGAGQGLILVNFEQASVANVHLNEVLEFTFSEALDRASISPASVQIRRGPDFGLTVSGALKVSGAVMTFEADLPGNCDYSDAGFQPDTEYRVSLIGGAEGLVIRNSVGQALEETVTYTFRTQDSDLFRDGAPGEAPFPTSITPADGTAVVPVAQGNQIVVEFSENIDPCSVNQASVLLYMVEVGDIDDGFIPEEDNSEDPLSWGSTNAVTTINPAQRIPSTVLLVQDYETVRLTVTPDFGEFAENALLVLSLTFEIQDFGGTPLAPVTVSFTTENLTGQTGVRTLEFDDTTPIDQTGTTADVNTSRAPGRAQGYLLFSGDGDNGEDSNAPSLPNSVASGCMAPLQANNGARNELVVSEDVVLDTGDTVNTCPNTVDGSTAVVWELKSFTILSGGTVRVIGKNPAIILVQDEIIIESGGTLLARGDGVGGSPQGRGGNGSATNTNGTNGGVGVAGGGDGGDGPTNAAAGTGRYGGDGFQGYFTDSNGDTASEVGNQPGIGGGEGNTSGFWNSQTVCNRNVPSGGGGGHATGGSAGTALGSGTSPVSLDLALKGEGGETYPNDERLLHAEAGSGGGAGGQLRSFAGTAAVGPGGGGGAGGGFIDLTCSGDIIINGRIDASGGTGGKGAGNPFSPNYTYNPGTGGGGGGSGGGIRIITARNITLGSTAIVTAAGGAGGAGGTNQGTAAPVNNGGQGGVGRIIMEDADSVVTGLSGAVVIPGEGSDGFYRGAFDPTRFAGGGLNTEALTEPILAGPVPVGGTSPAYVEPAEIDFVAGIPAPAARGQGATGILVEARGWQMTTEGDIDMTAGPSAWSTVGSFANTGSPAAPAWKSSTNYGIPADIVLSPDNPGTMFGLAPLSGYAYVQIRVTFYLPPTASPLTAGPYIDSMAIQFNYDQ